MNDMMWPPKPGLGESLKVTLLVFGTIFVLLPLRANADEGVEIHFLAPFRIELERAKDYRKAIHGTMQSVGKALIFTSIIFTAGFFIFLVSGFQATRNLGALVGFTVLGALGADLLLLPVLIWVFRPFGQEKRTST